METLLYAVLQRSHLGLSSVYIAKMKQHSDSFALIHKWIDTLKFSL